MAALSTLIPLLEASIDQAMLLLSAPKTAESLRPARCLKGSLASLIGAAEIDELAYGHSRLELDSVHNYGVNP